MTTQEREALRQVCIKLTIIDTVDIPSYVEDTIKEAVSDIKGLLDSESQKVPLTDAEERLVEQVKVGKVLVQISPGGIGLYTMEVPMRLFLRAINDIPTREETE